MLHDLLSGQHLAAVPEEELQKALFRGDQAHFLPFFTEDVRLQIIGEIAQKKELARLTACPLEHGLDLFHQHRQRKRLGHIIITARIKTSHHVFFRILGRHHDHRHLTVQTDARQKLPTVAVRQIDIQKHQIRRFFQQAGGCLQTIRLPYCKTRLFQSKGDPLAKQPVILHHQDRLHLPVSFLLCDLPQPLYDRAAIEHPN